MCLSVKTWRTKKQGWRDHKKGWASGWSVPTKGFHHIYFGFTNSCTPKVMIQSNTYGFLGLPWYHSYKKNSKLIWNLQFQNMQEHEWQNLTLGIYFFYRSGNMGVIINQLNRLNETRESEESVGEKIQEKHMSTVSDFDVDAVCSLLTQANEVR